MDNSTIWHRLMRNTASNFAGAMVPMVIGFVLLPFIISKLGAAQYGIWILTGGIIGYMGLVNMGLTPTVTKLSAELLAKSEYEELNRMLSTVVVLYFLLGVVLGLLVLIASPFVTLLFTVDEEHARLFRYIFLLIGIQAALTFPLSIFGGLVHGLQDFHFSNAVIIVNSILRLIGTYLLLQSGYGLISLIVLEFALSALSWTAQIIWVRGRIEHLRISPYLFDRRQIKGLIHFSGAMFVWRIASMTIRRANRIIIGLFLPLSSITVYEVGNRTIDYSRTFFINFLSPLLPAAAEIRSTGSNATLRNIYLHGTKLILASYSPIVAGLFLWGDEFIRLWMGAGFEDAAYIIFVLLVGNAYQAQNVVAHIMLPAMGMLRFFTRIMVVYPVLFIVSALVLVQTHGLIGVAIAASFTHLVMETVFLRKIVSIFDISYTDFFKGCHLPWMKAMIPALVAGIAIDEAIAVNTWLRLVMASVVFAAIFALTFWHFGLDKAEQLKIRNTFISLRRRAQPDN